MNLEYLERFMGSSYLQKLYQEQLIKAGVDLYKAQRAAELLTKKEFQLIGDIWPEWEKTISQIELQDWEQETLADLEVHPSAYSPIKRFIDIIGALVGLSLLAIIIIPIAVAIKLDSPGNIFYSQKRCGLEGKYFRIWKFRTMIANADQYKHLVDNEVKGYIFKNQNDPRITRIGKLLRCTSIDELPQFWNVLKGEMSLVGTRPPSPDEVSYYRKHHYRRLLVKPGMTGEWQVNGRSFIKDFEEIVQMDLAYQYKWSPLYDLKLIVKTIAVVFMRRGAF